MEAQYQILAAALVPHLKAGWIEALIEGEVADDHTDLQFSQRLSDQSSESFVPDVDKRLDARRALREIRQTMHEDARAPWSQCTFRLFPDGTFRFDVTYQDTPAS